MFSPETATRAPALLAMGLRRRLSRWSDRLREADRRRREAATLAGLPDEILRDIGVVRRGYAPPRSLMLPLDRR